MIMEEKKKKKKKRPVYFIPMLVAGVVLMLALTGYLAWQYDHGKKEKDDTGPVNILVLGNDLLVTNDVSDSLRQIFKASQSDREVLIESIALPDPKYGIVNHLQSQSLASLLSKNNDWHFVVLQDSPEALLDTPYILLSSIRQLQDKIKGKKTRYVFVEPFVSNDDLVKQEVVSAVSRKLCKNLSLQIAPVGEIFYDVKNQYPNTRIFADDNRLPSSNGSWLMAVTLYSTLTGKAPDANQAKIFYSYGTGKQNAVTFSRGEIALITAQLAKTVIERNLAFKLGLSGSDTQARGVKLKP